MKIIVTGNSQEQSQAWRRSGKGADGWDVLTGLRMKILVTGKFIGTKPSMGRRSGKGADGQDVMTAVSQGEKLRE